MEMVETSRRVSSLSLVREALGYRIDMLMSAVGRAYLAFCPQEESREIIDHLRTHPQDCINPQRITLAGTQRMLEETRLRGYGTRDHRYGGSSMSIKAFDDGLSSIAVPILVDPDRVLGCLTIVWLRRFNLEQEIVRTHLPQLRAAATKVAAAWTLENVAER
ncbi:DNA-binding transcriptional activator MhpR [compost metagenome]